MLFCVYESCSSCCCGCCCAGAGAGGGANLMGGDLRRSIIFFTFIFVAARTNHIMISSATYNGWLGYQPSLGSAGERFLGHF